MSPSKAHIIAQLQKQILPLQGYKNMAMHSDFDSGLGVINRAFPNDTFPLGAVHEFFCTGVEGASASSGFIAAITSSLMKKGGAALWISPSRFIFPPALKAYGIDPDKIIFVDVQKERERLWVLEEALKCEGLSAVIAEMPELSFTESRRLQLAVEQSRVTGFVLRRNPRNLTTACVTRWSITSLPSDTAYGLPGVGFPRWNVQLLKVRNGTPGHWQLEWVGDGFKHVYKLATINRIEQRKVG